MPHATREMSLSNSIQQSNPFIRQLASSERKTRDRALSSLRTYLQRSTPFSELDFLKLWKGLFFCMWMQDKLFNQQRLARDLASLVDELKNDANFLGFIGAFWKTMAREWEGIDALRMDKYLYLIRCYVNKAFEYISRRDWGEEGLLDAYLDILRQVPFNASDGKIPNGLRYHAIDIYVDELEKVDTKRTAPVDRIVAPMRELGKETVTKSVRKRVQEALDDVRLQNWSEPGMDRDTAVDGHEESSDHDDDDGDDEFAGFDD